MSCLQERARRGRQPWYYFDVRLSALSIHISVTTVGMWVKMPKLDSDQPDFQLPALQLTTQPAHFFPSHFWTHLLAFPSAFEASVLESKSPKPKII